MLSTAPIEVVPSAARTATGQGNGFAVTRRTLTLAVDITAASGTSPTLQVGVDWSADGTTWIAADPADQFTSRSSAFLSLKEFPRKAAYARVKWTIGGTTPSFTFSVKSH